MKKCLLIILLFFILIYSSLSAELKNNIEELYKKKQFDKIIFKYDKADNDFNSNEKYIIAKVLKQEGRKQNAKSLYFELLDRGYKNQSFLYKLWNLIDRDEKGFFFKNALKHYPKNNFVKYRYINYLESTRNYEKLIYFLEKNLQNSNYHNTNTINKLINLYLQKGLFKNRYSKYKSAGTVLSLYMSVIADDYKYFRKKFISLSRKKQNKLIKFVLKKGKLKILNKSYNNLKNRKYKLLLDYLVNEKTISVDNISSDKLKFILNSCMEYGKFKKAEKLLKNIETNNKYLVIKSKIAIFNENYYRAFELLQLKYRMDSYFNLDMISDLVDKIEFNKIEFRSEPFLQRILNLLMRNNDYEKVIELYPRITESKRKLSILSFLKNKIEYKKWRKMLDYADKKYVISRFADYLLLHKDDYLIGNLQLIKKTEKLKNKNTLLGDIHFFLLNENQKALKYYKKIKFSFEKNYKLCLFYFINKNYSRVEDILEKGLKNYKGFLLLAGDYYILQGKKEKGITYYNKALGKIESDLRDLLHKRIYFKYKENFDKLKMEIKVLKDKDSYLIWR